MWLFGRVLLVRTFIPILPVLFACLEKRKEVRKEKGLMMLTADSTIYLVHTIVVLYRISKLLAISLALLFAQGNLEASWSLNNYNYIIRYFTYLDHDSRYISISYTEQYMRVGLLRLVDGVCPPRPSSLGTLRIKCNANATFNSYDTSYDWQYQISRTKKETKRLNISYCGRYTPTDSTY